MFYKYVCGLAIMAVSANAWCATLQDNGDHTVTDMDTGHTWQQVDDDIKRDWKSAQRYCHDQSLGGETDWRLPTPTELASIVVYRSTNPTIDETLFPSTDPSGYWSAISMAGNSWQAWIVDFQFGSVDFSRKKESHYVRCIR